MEHEVHTFKEWGYPFIAQDFQDAAGVDCSGLLLGGIVLFSKDMASSDNWTKVIEKITEYIDDNIPAIMVELYHLSTMHRLAATCDLVEILKKNGYTNLESYEDRLAYGKFPKGE